LTGLGVGLVLLFFIKWSKEVKLIGIIALLCWSYYFFSNISQWLVYAIPAFAFGSILIGIGAGNFTYRKEWLGVFIIAPIIFCGLNLGFYDIGRTIDKTPTSAQRLYSGYEGLPSVPDGCILYIYELGEAWLTTYYYSEENGNRFSFLWEGELKYHPETYSRYKEKLGINLPEDYDKYGEKSPNGLIYSTWYRDIFLNDLCSLNPDKEVYTLERTWKNLEEVDFGFVRWYPTSEQFSPVP
jgi:hypothetical protein